MPRTSNLLWALDARVPSDRTCHVSVLSSGAVQSPAAAGAHLGALVVDGDLVVAVRVFAGQQRLQGLFHLNKEAAGLH